ncbi:MAG: ComEC/Rec2 family competence protein, partial [Spirochaetota bacterium]
SGRVRSVAAARDRFELVLAEATSASVEAGARGAAVVLAEVPASVEPGSRVTVARAPQSPLWRDEQGRLWVKADAVLEDRPAGGAAVRPPLLVRLRRSLRSSAGRVGGRAGPLLVALLLGETADLDPRMRLLFRRAGAVHLLALSGMHLAVIAMLVGACARPLAGVRVATWIAVVAGVLYLVVAGPRPGLVRAALMVTIMSALRAVDQRRPLPEVLAATFLIQLVVQPGVAASIGFQLSYLSLSGIALVASPLGERLRGLIPPGVASPLAAGFGAQLATAPLVVASFGVWYPIGIAASVLLGPIITGFMTVGMVGTAASMIGLSAIEPAVRAVLELTLDAVVWLSWLFSAAPSIAPGRPHALVIMLSIVAAGATLAGLTRTYRRDHGVEGNRRLADAHS